MFGRNIKLNNEINRVLDDINHGATDTRIDPAIAGKDVSESLNSFFDKAIQWKKVADSQQAAIEEIHKLSDSIIEGQLTVRASTDKFDDEYTQIVQGINDIVETLVGHINNIPVPFMIIDKDFNVSYVNDKAAEMASSDSGSMIGTKCYGHYKTNVCQSDGCVCARSMKTQNAEHGEAVADIGRDVHLSCSGMPLKNRQGNVIGSLEIFTDQTEMKSGLEEANAKAEILNSIPTPVVAIDKEFNVQFMNPAGAALVGRSVDGCVGQKCYSLFNTPHCNTENCQVARAMETDRVCRADTKASLASGEIPIRYSGTALKDHDGNVIGGLEYVLDITSEVNVTEEVLKLTDSAIDGKLDARADGGKFSGNNQEIVEGINKTIDALVAPLRVSAEYIDCISKGEIPEKITDEYKGDFNEIKNNLNTCIDAINALLDDSAMLSTAAGEGHLDVTADVSIHGGKFRDIIENLNSMLESIATPLDECMAVLNKLSVNDYTEKVEREYQGSFAEVASATNSIRDRMLTVLDVNKRIAVGDLSDLEVLKKTGKRSENDELIPCFITMMSNIEGIVDEFIKLGNAAEAGTLDYRANASIYEGSFRDAISTVNLAVDAFVSPMTEAMRMINEYSAGHLDTRFGFETEGDFKKFADTVDDFGENLQAIIADSSKVLEAISNNDLSQAITVKGVGDFKVLTDGIENSRQSLNTVVSMVHSSSRNVAATSEEMAASVEEMSSSSTQVTNTVNEISMGAQSQAAKTEEVSRAMVDMTTTVQEVALNSQKTAENAKDSNELINDLGRITADLLVKMASIKDASSESSTVIKELDGKSKQIGEIVSLITSIADQTNLLALNAAIEAARAGEHGRGFAVVADEVRKLAEDSGNAAKQIATLITEIQEGTHNAVTSMQQGSEEVETGATALNEVAEVIENVVDSGTHVAHMIQDIAAAAEEQSASIEEVTSSIQEVSAISQESAAGTQEASAAVQEQTATMQELAKSAEDLSSLAGEMKGVVDKFILDSHPQAHVQFDDSELDEEIEEKEEEALV